MKLRHIAPIVLLAILSAGAQKVALDKDLKPGIVLPASNTRGKSVSITLSMPATTDTGLVQFPMRYAVTITRVACSTDAGTATVNFDVRTESAPNTPGTDVLAAALTCTTSTGSTTSIAVPNVATNGIVSLQVPSVSGAQALRVHLFYQFQ